jgi:tRNA G18 (ribose-2'-O)-methylase SpoU
MVDSKSCRVVPACAVCCAAAAFGFGAVHCIMSASDKYKRSQRTAAGADKWLDMRLWDDTTQCLTALKGAGYQVVVTSLQQHSVTIQVRGREGRYTCSCWWEK